MTSKGRHWLPWAGLLLVVLMAVSPLWGAPPYGDDIRLHVFRIPVINAVWQSGELYARWIPFLNLGYGSPLFNFYPPLSAYSLTALYWLVGQNAPVAINLLFALSLLLGATGMFLCGRLLYGPAGGLLAAILYTWSPHVLFQIYGRGSISNALALALFPLALWALWRACQRPSLTRAAQAGLLLALVILAHTAASFLFVAPLLLLGLAAAFGPGLDRRLRWPRAKMVVLALLLGLGLSAFAWLPALSEIQATRYALEAGKVDFSEHFADIFRWPDTTVAAAHNPALPKSVGMTQIVMGITGLLLAGWSLWRWRQAAPRATVEPSALTREWLTAVAALIGLGTLFLATTAATPIWTYLSPLRALQFPWRLLDIPALLLALSGGRVLATRATAGLGEKGDTVAIWRRTLAALAVIVSFANMIPYLHPAPIRLPLQPTLADTTAVQQQYGIYGLTAWGEYSAPAVTTWPTTLPFTAADQIIPLSDKVNGAPAGFTAVAGDPWQAAWESDLAAAAVVTLAVHNFPGWQATIDGEAQPVATGNDGTLQLKLPAGRHQVELAFVRTAPRLLADMITLLSLAAMIVILLVWLGRRSPRPYTDPGGLTVAQQRLLAALIGLVTVLLLVKIVWLDRVSNPLVTYIEDGQIAGTVTPPTQNFDDKLVLLGYQIDGPDKLTLFWQAGATHLPRLQTQVTLTDASGTPVKELVNRTPGYTVTSNWEPGQLIRDEVLLPVNDLPGPAGYTVSVAVQDERDGRWLPLSGSDGTTAVPLGRVKKAPGLTGIVETVGANFNDQIKLRHSDIPATIPAGGPLEFSLYWEALAPVAEDYTLFVHLLNADGTLAAGQDGQPVQGRYPTSYWEAGELIEDERLWLPDAAPGVYHLQVGWYLLESGERLPLAGPGTATGDRVIIQALEITP